MGDGESYRRPGCSKSYKQLQLSSSVFFALIRETDPSDADLHRSGKRGYHGYPAKSWPGPSGRFHVS